MKKIFFTAAVLAAVCIGFPGCANAAGGGADNPPPAVNHPLAAGTYNVNATLSVYAPAMKLDLAKGQPDKG